MIGELKKLVAKEELDIVLEKLLDHLESNNPGLYNIGVTYLADISNGNKKP